MLRNPRRHAKLIGLAPELATIGSVAACIIAYEYCRGSTLACDIPTLKPEQRLLCDCASSRISHAVFPLIASALSPEPFCVTHLNQQTLASSIEGCLMSKCTTSQSWRVSVRCSRRGTFRASCGVLRLCGFLTGCTCAVLTDMHAVKIRGAGCGEGKE